MDFLLQVTLFVTTIILASVVGFIKLCLDITSPLWDLSQWSIGGVALDSDFLYFTLFVTTIILVSVVDLVKLCLDITSLVCS